ncbi:MAG TPA: hypothetical protein DCS29_04505 [Candidatus Magasanikbacteria bacterium]|nr:MAG: hypothetical protein A2479_01170 [Candidatus Magasanikbacteria bacterium RIFOXYC2_FULL_39_8]HAT04002.1 hypothetical protein [Candidatus Magasanikbacteria bacterium]
MQVKKCLQFLKIFFPCEKRGTMLIFVMVFGAIAFTTIVLGVSGYALFEHRASMRLHKRDMALHIAEAGINYYKWHLAHNQEDYWDGTGGDDGPYIHEYYDKDGNVIGYFSLEIEEPLSGAHVVIVRSTGWTTVQPSSTRTLQVRLGFPSLTDYAFVEQSNMSFSPTTQVHGKVHSNGFIQFDGVTDSWVDSAQPNGVYGNGGPTEFWRDEMPPKDFYGITSDLEDIEELADNGGIHLNSSGKEGYHLVFKNNGTFDRYRVRTRSCYNGQGFYLWIWWIGETHCYDIGTQQLQGNFAIPSNGVIFVEDNVWVDGVVNGRVTIGAGRFPVSYEEIYISGNLTYYEKGSDDVIGLIAQGDVIVPRNVPNDMEIDAAALSQFRSLGRPYYYQNIKNSLFFFGSQISFEGGGWKHGSPVESGFVYTNHTYDGNLLYNPPPGFPVEATYELISWEEVET